MQETAWIKEKVETQKICDKDYWPDDLEIVREWFQIFAHISIIYHAMSVLFHFCSNNERLFGHPIEDISHFEHLVSGLSSNAKANTRMSPVMQWGTEDIKKVYEALGCLIVDKNKTEGLADLYSTFHWKNCLMNHLFTKEIKKIYDFKSYSEIIRLLCSSCKLTRDYGEDKNTLEKMIYFILKKTKHISFDFLCEEQPDIRFVKVKQSRRT